VHRVPGGADVFEQGIEEGAVLEDLGRVAGDRHAERHAGDGRQQLVDRQVALELQVRVLVPLDRPDGEAEDGDGGEQDGNDRIHRIESTNRMSHDIGDTRTWPRKRVAKRSK